MFPADGRNAGVVNSAAADSPGCQKLLQHFPMTVEFTQQPERRRSHPDFDLFDGLGERRRRLLDIEVSNNGEEFVNTRPRQTPRRRALGEVVKDARRLAMPFRVAPVRIDQNVGI